MKNYFLILLLSLFMAHTVGATPKPFAEYIGKPGSSIKTDMSNAIEYRYDTLTTQFFISGFKYLDVFVFNDTIFKIIVIEDGSLFDEPCTIDTTYEDEVLLQKFEQYYIKKYQAKPDYSTAPIGVMKLKQQFGLACGPAGGATELGARYLILADKANYSPAEVKRLLVSFNPNDRLIGLLLYNKNPIEEMAPVAQVVLASPLTFHYCYGCEPSMKPMKTAEEISLIVKSLRK